MAIQGAACDARGISEFASFLGKAAFFTDDLTAAIVEELPPLMKTGEALNAALPLTHYFDSIVGAPVEKQDALLSILVGDQMLPHQALAIGDSMTELRAAQALRIPFIGIASPDAPDPFPAETVVLPNLAAADAMWNSGR